MSENTTFDDFKEQESYVNETIGRVIEKQQTEVEDFKENSIDMTLLMSNSPKDELRDMYVQYIQGAGDISQVNYCDYVARGGVALDAWGFTGDEDMTSIDLFIVAYQDPEESIKISSAEMDRYFNRLQRFYEQSVFGAIFKNIDNEKSDLYQIAQLINTTPKIDRLRLFVLTNAIVNLDYEKSNIELEPGGTICEFHTWDARRVMHQDHILSGRESIKVDFEGDYNISLPCIKMPDVSDNVVCYLCIIPGMVLSQVYHKYNQQILEMNVRTFLQFKGTSNKGIRNTLIGYTAKKRGEVDVEAEPDMFFAYNNGISATASEVTLSEDGRSIVKIKDWQIVNGGQTTAAIHAVMNMKDVNIRDLSTVYVAMKVSVIKDKEKLNIIVPKISRFANTQSAVKKSDYDINEGFLIDLEQCSREEWVLNSMKKPVSKWFFERTRGQYLDKAKRQPNAKAEKEFFTEYPRSQMFDKTTLSKFMLAWDQNPASVCKGGENNYAVFFERTKKAGIRFDKTKYRRAIAKAILFKAIDAYYGKDGVSLAGYKSNMVAYTLSVLSYSSGKALDLDKIWDEQCVINQSVYNELTIDIYSVYARLVCGAEHVTYKVKESYVGTDGKRRNHYNSKAIPAEDLALLKQTALYKVLLYVKKIQPIIYAHLVSEVNEGENINEWTKKSLCWDGLKTKLDGLDTKFKFPQELCSEAGDMDVEITEGQRRVISAAMEKPSSVWTSIHTWGRRNGSILTPRELAFLRNMAWYAEDNRSISYRQAKYALDILERAEDAGWKEDE